MDQVAVSATSFFSGVIVARHCSLSELGVYHMALSILLIMREVQADLITSPFAVYSHHRQGRDLDAYTGSVLVHQALCVLVSMIIFGIIWLVTYAVLTPISFLAVTPVLFFAGPIILIREYIRQHLFARLQFETAFFTDLTVLVVQLAGLYWVATTAGLTVVRTFGVIGAAGGIASILWWHFARPKFFIDRQQVLEDWGRNWSFGRWAVASYLVCSSTPALMTWIVAWLRSEGEAGKLAACITLVGLSNLFTTAIANVLTPNMAMVYASEAIPGLRRICARVSGLFLIVLGGFTILVFILGDSLGALVYGPAFDDVGYLCGLVALGILANSLSIVAGNALWAIDQPRGNLPADVTNALITLVAAFLLIPSQGIWGAALANLAGFAVGALVRWLMVFYHWSRLNAR